MNSIEKLTQIFSQFPGIGPRQAKRFVYYLAGFWSIFTCTYIALISVAPIPDKNIRFVDTILGFLLGTVVATIIQFFLGSSVGSKAKDTLAEILAVRK